jgi:diaminopimelate epimerase
VLENVALHNAGRDMLGVAVHFPNPHVVVPVGDVADAGSLHDAPTLADPTVLPNGTNFEFVESLAPGRVRIRIHERGVGETLACGTGACAVAWLHAQEMELGDDANVAVELPGGRVFVSRVETGEWVLTGPAVLLATGLIDQGWWHAHESS